MTTVAMVHYGPGDRPLCGDESQHTVQSYDPTQAAGCSDCLVQVAQGLADRDEYRGRCP